MIHDPMVATTEQAAADDTQSPTEVAELVAELRRARVDPQLTRQLRLDIERGLPRADTDWT
jgi:hypothetical protein